MTASALKDRIAEMCTHVLFEFRGRDCGVDPITSTHFVMWFGTDTTVAKNIDEVMKLNLFDDLSLTDIAEQIEIYE